MEGYEGGDQQMNQACEAEPISELDRLRREFENFKSWGIIEVAVRNPNVRDYMDHWEGRALKAEAALVKLSKPES